ncbi:MAG TPA: GGDEF domain-containing protein [Pseudonocardiaceae bacterium]|nr:GGDEF domain-containing protein [Pseudonocardiaceae bacterium]
MEVVTVGVTAAVANRFPITNHDWLIFGLLLAGSMVHMEAVRGIERIREQVRANAPLVDLKSVWTFASILLLPPVLAIALSALTYAHLRLRIIHRQTFRWVYSAATVMLAAAASAAVLDIGLPPGSYPGLPFGWRGVALIVLAGLVRWFFNHGLVVVIILLSSPSTPGKDALGNFSDNIVEAAALSLGAVTAMVIEHDLWYLVLILPPLLVLHRSLLMRQYEVAARTDTKTGLANATHWSQMARSELARAQRYDNSVGILMLDLDHFKKINDTYGHLTGDNVLKAVADALRKETRDYDLVGRFGGEEFLVLLPGVDDEELRTVAERFRHCVSTVQVTAMETYELVPVTASAGAICYPSGGEDLDELLLAVDAALYAAKAGGRDRTCFAPAGGQQLPEQRGH